MAASSAAGCRRRTHSGSARGVGGSEPVQRHAEGEIQLSGEHLGRDLAAARDGGDLGLDVAQHQDVLAQEHAAAMEIADDSSQQKRAEEEKSRALDGLSGEERLQAEAEEAAEVKSLSSLLCPAPDGRDVEDRR